MSWRAARGERSTFQLSCREAGNPRAQGLALGIHDESGDCVQGLRQDRQEDSCVAKGLHASRHRQLRGCTSLCLSCSRHCASEHTIIIAPTGRTHAAQARCERIDTLIRELEKAKTCLDTLNADGCAGTRAEEGGTAGEEKSIAKSSARQDAGDVEAMETETETEIETRMDTEPSLHPGSNPVEVSSTSSL